jgi:hypothetical protein
MTALDEMAGWIDKLAIQEAINRYSDAVTRGDWDQFEGVWAPDAVWEVAPPVDIKIDSARAIRELVSGMLDAYDFVVQTSHSSVITLLGNASASATSTIQEIGRTEGSQEMMQFGIYWQATFPGLRFSPEVGSDLRFRFFSSCRQYPPFRVLSRPSRGLRCGRDATGSGPSSTPSQPVPAKPSGALATSSCGAGVTGARTPSHRQRLLLSPEVVGAGEW